MKKNQTIKYDKSINEALKQLEESMFQRRNTLDDNFINRWEKIAVAEAKWAAGGKLKLKPYLNQDVIGTTEEDNRIISEISKKILKGIHPRPDPVFVTREDSSIDSDSSYIDLENETDSTEDLLSDYLTEEDESVLNKISKVDASKQLSQAQQSLEEYKREDSCSEGDTEKKVAKVNASKQFRQAQQSLEDSSSGDDTEEEVLHLVNRKSSRIQNLKSKDLIKNAKRKDSRWFKPEMVAKRVRLNHHVLVSERIGTGEDSQTQRLFGNTPREETCKSLSFTRSKKEDSQMQRLFGNTPREETCKSLSFTRSKKEDSQMQRLFGNTPREETNKSLSFTRPKEILEKIPLAFECQRPLSLPSTPKHVVKQPLKSPNCYQGSINPFKNKIRVTKCSSSISCASLKKYLDDIPLSVECVKYSTFQSPTSASLRSNSRNSLAIQSPTSTFLRSNSRRKI